MHDSKLAATIAFLSSALARPRPTMNEPDLILCFDSATGTYRQCPYINIVNQYIPGLANGKRFTRDAYLESTAMDTVVKSNGGMQHLAHPGILAQVLAPHRQDNFRNPFVGGWLCERLELLYVKSRQIDNPRDIY